MRKVRILFLTSVFPPLGYSGHDERCRQMINALAKYGHNIQLLTSDYRLPPLGMKGERGIYRELKLYPTPTAGESGLGDSFAATYGHERYNAGTLNERISRFQPDVVYVWNMQGLSKSLLFQLQAGGIPLIYDLHSDWLLPENFNADPWYRWWFNNSSFRSKLYKEGNRFFGRARRILRALPIKESTELNLKGSYVVSEWLKATLAENGLSDAAGLPVIYPGLELDKILPKNKFQPKKRFLWAGRLTEAKGADLAVEAIGILKGRGIDAKLDLFGMGDPRERKAKRARIEALGLIDRVRMRGIRPGEMTKHYAHYDAILYTSRSGEPFSMTVLEALLSRLPLIAANVGGHTEILRDRRNTLFFEAGNAELLADAMVEFMGLPDAGQTIVSHDFDYLQSRHSTLEICSEIESFLAKAATNGHQPVEDAQDSLCR
jgi:glycosyltransferase involved in cell wall biosynthesis